MRLAVPALALLSLLALLRAHGATAPSVAGSDHLGLERASTGAQTLAAEAAVAAAEAAVAAAEAALLKDKSQSEAFAYAMAMYAATGAKFALMEADDLNVPKAGPLVWAAISAGLAYKALN